MFKNIIVLELEHSQEQNATLGQREFQLVSKWQEKSEQTDKNQTDILVFTCM